MIVSKVCALVEENVIKHVKLVEGSKKKQVLLIEVENKTVAFLEYCVEEVELVHKTVII